MFLGSVLHRGYERDDVAGAGCRKNECLIDRLNYCKRTLNGLRLNHPRPVSVPVQPADVYCLLRVIRIGSLHCIRHIPDDADGWIGFDGFANLFG